MRAGRKIGISGHKASTVKYCSDLRIHRAVLKSSLYAVHKNTTHSKVYHSSQWYISHWTGPHPTDLEKDFSQGKQAKHITPVHCVKNIAEKDVQKLAFSLEKPLSISFWLNWSSILSSVVRIECFISMFTSTGSKIF